MTKRLLLVLTEFPPSFGGMQTHALELSQWLFARGYYVEVATYRIEEGPMELPELPFVVHRIMSRVAYQANLRKLAQLARGREFEPFDHSLDVQISRLRKLIEPDPSSPLYIQTVWGLGYVFIPEGQPR